MRKLKNVVFIAVAASLLTACTGKKQSNSATAQTVKDSVMWEGTYEGVITDGNSTGVYTLLALDDEGDYEMFQKTLQEHGSLVSKGKFEWNATGDNIVLSDNNQMQFSVSENVLHVGNATLAKISDEDDLDDVYTEYYVKDDKSGNNYNVEVYKENNVVFAEIEIDDKDYKLKKESEYDKEAVFTDGVATLKWNTKGNYRPQFTDGKNTYHFTLFGPANEMYESKDENAPVKTVDVLYFIPDEGKAFVKVLSAKAENCYTLTQTEGSAKTAIYKKDGIAWETKVNNDAVLEINGQRYRYEVSK